MNYTLFDTHAHYDDERFSEDRFETIRKAHEDGVECIINAASNIASAEVSISLAQEFDFVYAAVGLYPQNVKEGDDNTLVTLADFCKNPKVVAIGEIGLDYYYDSAPRDMQRYWLAQQINLAKELRLPVIIHDRDAHEDTMRIIKEENAKEVGGVFHCYSGSVEMAREVLANNFYISVGGAVTFKNAKRIIEVVKEIPEEKLLIETDCPYMTPEPFRGKRNDSSYIKLVAEKIAEIRGTSFERIASITSENGRALFKIKKIN
jgi:TatD DNase family protein